MEFWNMSLSNEDFSDTLWLLERYRLLDKLGTRKLLLDSMDACC